MISREQQIFDQQYFQLARKVDRLFAWIFLFQWVLGIVFALWISPETWMGGQSETHLHVYAAIFLGGIIASFPIFLAWNRPGHSFNRYVVATAQMLFSILLIHLTGGRIETHFHVFGSLAFIAFYRDPRPVVLATLITAADHLLRGYYWPESVYGVIFASPFRALEHSAWVLFEDFFLFIAMKIGMDEMHAIAKHQAKAEAVLADVERQVEERTRELQQHQQALAVSSKLSSLGEMAGGIAHEINTPLTIIGLKAEQLAECLKEGDTRSMDPLATLQTIRQTTDRIAKIVKGLRSFAKDQSGAPPQRVLIRSVLEETLNLCGERFKNQGVRLEVIDDPAQSAELDCRPIELSQVLLNLLNNAYDAIEPLADRWIRVEVSDLGSDIRIRIIDSGPGIPAAIRDKLMQPFFTTKGIGKGTGLGLSISKGIVESQGGRLLLDPECPNTCFVIELPKRWAGKGDTHVA